MNLLSIVVYTFLSLIGVIFVLLALKEIIPRISYLLYYKSQNIPFHYVPIFGVTRAVFSGSKTDIFGNIKDLLRNKYRDNEIIAFNAFNGTHISFLLNNLKVIRDFFIKENDYTVRVNLKIFPDMGFFYESGEKALNRRGIFSDFFKSDNLEKVTPLIQKIILEKLKEFKKEEFKSGTELHIVNLRPLLTSIFSDIVNEVIFGSFDSPLIDGKKIPAIFLETTNLAMSVYRDPLNMLTFGLLPILGLDKRARRSKYLLNKIAEEVKKTVKKRLETENREYGLDMIDLMLKHNANNKDDQLTMEEIINNSNAFINAGIDTSQNTTESYLKIISQKEDILEKLVEEEIPRIFKKEEDFNNYYNYDKSELLNCTLDEIMRLLPVAGIPFGRVITKDIKIGKYNLKKGNHILIPVIALQHNPKYFENPDQFISDRFSSNGQKIKKNSFMPFMGGKRNCVGKYLGELTVKMVLINLLNRFKIRGTDRKYTKTVRFVYGVDQCDVLIGLKDKKEKNNK